MASRAGDRDSGGSSSTKKKSHHRRSSKSPNKKHHSSSKKGGNGSKTSASVGEFDALQLAQQIFEAKRKWVLKLRDECKSEKLNEHQIRNRVHNAMESNLDVSRALCKDELLRRLEQCARDRGSTDITAMVGLRVAVYWPLDKCYYKGIVTKVDPISEKHRNKPAQVSYDDGQIEWLDLRKEVFKVLKPKPNKSRRNDQITDDNDNDADADADDGGDDPPDSRLPQSEKALSNHASKNSRFTKNDNGSSIIRDNNRKKTIHEENQQSSSLSEMTSESSKSIAKLSSSGSTCVSLSNSLISAAAAGIKGDSKQPMKPPSSLLSADKPGPSNHHHRKSNGLKSRPPSSSRKKRKISAAMTSDSDQSLVGANGSTSVSPLSDDCSLVSKKSNNNNSSDRRKRRKVAPKTGSKSAISTSINSTHQQSPSLPPSITTNVVSGDINNSMQQNPVVPIPSMIVRRPKPLTWNWMKMPSMISQNISQNADIPPEPLIPAPPLLTHQLPAPPPSLPLIPTAVAPASSDDHCGSSSNVVDSDELISLIEGSKENPIVREVHPSVLLDPESDEIAGLKDTKVAVCLKEIGWRDGVILAERVIRYSDGTRVPVYEVGYDWPSQGEPSQQWVSMKHLTILNSMKECSTAVKGGVIETLDDGEWFKGMVDSIVGSMERPGILFFKVCFPEFAEDGDDPPWMWVDDSQVRSLSNNADGNQSDQNVVAKEEPSLPPPPPTPPGIPPIQINVPTQGVTMGLLPLPQTIIMMSPIDGPKPHSYPHPK